MAPQADNNVPWTGSPRLMTVNVEPAWHIQQFSAGVNAGGVAPAPNVPALSAQKVLWAACSAGGLFSFQGVQAPVIIDAGYTKLGAGTATMLIVGQSGATRALPAYPFKLAAGEAIQVTITGQTGLQTSEVGFLARIDGDRIL